MAEGLTDPKAAGWKRDPTGRFEGRYWDGAHWTEHVVNKERVRSRDPVAPAARQRPTPPSAKPVAAPSGATPSPGPSLLDRVPRGGKIGLVVVVAIGIAAALYSGTKKDDGSPRTPAPASKAVYSLGDTARVGQFDVTVYGFKNPQTPGEFLHPAAGSHYVSVDVQVANPGSRQRDFSYLLGFQLVDGSNTDFDPAFSDLAPPPPDGAIAAGRGMRGLAVFEVPEGAAGLRIRVRADLSGAAALFTLG